METENLKEQDLNQSERPLDLDLARERLAARQGRDYWSGLEELAATPEFEKWIDDEFPDRASIKEIDRRSLLKFMGASLMMASLAGCRTVFMDQPRLVPYTRDPEGMVPGKRLQYATAFVQGGYAKGTLVESVMGRPIKVEGNPEHPESMGASDYFMQAALMDLYDPDRAQTVSMDGDVATWDDFVGAAKERLAFLKETGGHGVWILTETVTSPTLISQLNAFLRQYPGARWVQYEPVHRDAAYIGARAAFGLDAQSVYDFAKAEVVLSLDADFVREGAGALRYTRDFALGRKVSNELAVHNRTYCLESTPTLVGATAEHVRRMKPSQIEECARTLAARVGVQNITEGAAVKGFDDALIAALVQDLNSHRGRCLVVPGEHQSPNVHALCHAMNVALGNVGSTVRYIRPVEVAPGRRLSDLGELVSRMRSGAVEMLFILGGNPAFNAPGDLGFADALAKVGFKAHLSKWVDETSLLCDWRLPESHQLEAWGDARAYDGAVTLMQPLIAPLYQSWSALEVVAALVKEPASGYDLVRDYWRSTRPGLGAKEFEGWWQESLHRGVVGGTQFETLAVNLNLNPVEPVVGGEFEIVLRPDPTVYDGRFANNGWLQECPKPLSTLTWDNAAQMSPATATKVGVTSEDVVMVAVGGKRVALPVWVMPGHPDDVVTVHFGYGRTAAGRIGNGVGSDAYPLMATASPYMGAATVEKARGAYPLAATQMHHFMEGRDLIREGTLANFLADPENRKLDPEPDKGPRDKFSMYPEQPMGKEFDGPQWGMTIDLDLCTGCHACVVACQAENNIPVVGKTQVKRGREMHWIRIDRYYRVAGRRDDGSTEAKMDNLDGFKDAEAVVREDILEPNRVHTAFQPVNCMHCEAAPCEPVCPVAATVHSHEGLNQMVYNRCVGTRYCSNNCPYKVRRFNFLNYGDRHDYPSFGANRRPAPSLRLLNNPDVTVRGRGVMEKCTYCVQRINAARIEAKKENRPIRDGEIVTACQQACPTGAIVFGNIKDPASRIARAKANPRNYKLLEEINTKPRTTYLVRLSNPNPEIETA